MAMRAAIIDNGVVVNIAEADEVFAAEQGWIVSDAAAIGDLWDGQAFTRPEPPPPPVPQVVSMRQARLALHNASMLDDVEAVIITMDEPQRTTVQIEWEYSTEVRRTSPTTTMLAGTLGLSEEQIDQLFIDAAKL